MLHKCRLTSVSIDNALLTKSAAHDHELQPAADIAEHQHSDISAHYQYHCATPKQLNSIDLAGRKIQAQLISGDQQQGAELSAKNTSLNR